MEEIMDELGAENVEGTRTLSKEHKDSILAIIENKKILQVDQEAIKDDIKALADKLGITTTKVNKIVGLFIKETSKGGALQEEQDIIDLVEQVIN